MFFERQELRQILGTTENEIELRNEYGRCQRMVSRDEALTLDLDLFIGIGNRRRIRFLRARTQRFALNAGSHTTQRPKGVAGKFIAPPHIKEHRHGRGISE